MNTALAAAFTALDGTSPGVLTTSFIKILGLGLKYDVYDTITINEYNVDGEELYNKGTYN